ncbi:energy transducer TonB [Massilia atriviolacea]|uniref:Energy transducer TonB n=1 Tax=Massilia atriviolacea TaxID=2495579 RepID=A0A430HE46_9BURK|nr:energy transducer TonB [Massilia atriviolacea]RSZ55814.1 energy transducer TonB [Massilia atriviolacea]
MHFSQQHIGASNKFTKMAIVTALHVVVGAALIHSMNRVPSFSISEAGPIEVTPVIEKPVEPPPAEPQNFEPKQLQPTIVIPPPIDNHIAPPPDNPIVATVSDKVAPPPAAIQPSGPAVTDTPPAVPRPAAEKRTAVLADASACVKPDYPARAARDGATGTVNLALLVGVDGKVSDARVDKSSGSRDLDKAALAALSLCKFKPATVGGVAEPAWAQIAYVWTLD